MKIQCNVCETAEANVLCCADEAALCWGCDEKVHVANKLASKHHRLPLTTTTPHFPKCDICQEAAGFFFCLEDRALLCRKCDVAVHTANTFVTAHQRFLLTGVKVGLESTDPGASSSSGKSPSSEKPADTKFQYASRRGSSIPLTNQGNDVLPENAGSRAADLANVKVPFSGVHVAGGYQPWQMDELLGLTGFNQSYDYMDNGSSKADSGKLGDSDSSAILRSEEERDDDDTPGQVPDSSWAVPQMPSPPTASGLYWSKSVPDQFDSGFFVPDICHPSMRNGHHCQKCGSSKKRQTLQI